MSNSGDKPQSGGEAVGDVIQIPTRRGFAYAQVTHVHPSYGPLVRVVRGLDREPRQDWMRVVAEDTLTWYFTDPHVGVQQGLWRIVARVSVPDRFQPFPTFRWALPDLTKGRVRDVSDAGWWLWSGGQRTFVDRLSTQQRELPGEALTFPQQIVDEIEGQRGESVVGVAPAGVVDAAPAIEHLLVFPDQAGALSAAGVLQTMGYEIVTRDGSAPTSIRVAWRGTLVPDQVVLLQRQADQVAEQYGGTCEDSHVSISAISNRAPG